MNLVAENIRLNTRERNPRDDLRDPGVLNTELHRVEARVENRMMGKRMTEKGQTPLKRIH